MIGRIACAVFLVCPLVVGCGGLFRNGTRNLVNEAKLVRDERYEHIRSACLAHEAWEKVRAECPRRHYSSDYAAGFKAGFIDYLYAGGCGDPPALPPKHYRHFHGESAQGTQALQDWYAGFRHGAEAAKESGQRQFVLVSLPPPAAPPSPPPPPPPLDVPLWGSSLPAPSQLPAPRSMPAETVPNDGTDAGSEGTGPGSAKQDKTTEQPAPEGQS